MSRMEEARETLERLQQKDLPRLQNWQADSVVCLLTYILAVTKGTFTELSKRILEDSSLAILCKNLAEGGNFAAALTTAQQIDNSYSRAKAFIEIAKAQPTAENFAAALTTAQQIDSSHQRARALIEIAKAQPTAENFAAALTTAQQIDNSSQRAFELSKIAKAQVQAQNFAAALSTAQQIDDSSQRSKALMEIAKAQIEANFSKQALLTAEKILVNRNEHLLNIAAAFVQKRDQENFKRLLIPYAYYLDAAYKMCGHLAQLYPDQASDIAKIVITSPKDHEKNWSLEPQMRQELLLLGKELEQYATALAEIVGVEA
jgi:hypothetical protein